MRRLFKMSIINIINEEYDDGLFEDKRRGNEEILNLILPGLDDYRSHQRLEKLNNLSPQSRRVMILNRYDLKSEQEYINATPEDLHKVPMQFRFKCKLGEYNLVFDIRNIKYYEKRHAMDLPIYCEHLDMIVYYLDENVIDIDNVFAIQEQNTMLEQQNRINELVSKLANYISISDPHIFQQVENYVFTGGHRK